MSSRPNENVSVREAGPEDAGSVATILLRARHANVPAIPPLVHGDQEVREWVAATLMKDCEVWVAEADDELVGMMALLDDWIEQLYVTPEHASRGAGSRLVAVAKERRPDGLQLWTFESNVRAQRFYERHGFVAVDRTDGTGNEENAPDVRYRWSAVPLEESR